MDMNAVFEAQKRLKPYLAPSPLLYSQHLKRKLNKNIWLKLETQLPTGSFKPRPAFNSILSHLNEAKKRGVIASSSGNFAQGVAYAAHLLAVSALIVMSEKTSSYKIERTKQWGAEVVLCGNTLEDRENTTRELEKKTGRLFLHPYNTEETIAGDATLGLELADELGDALNDMSVFVPVSGGGLIAGIGFVLKTLYPKCKVIGVQPQANGALLQSLQTGKLINVGPVSSLADALTSSALGENSFKIIKKYVDEALLVDETEIYSTTQFLIEEHKLVVEPGGAISVAALHQTAADRCVCIISGGNLPLFK